MGQDLLTKRPVLLKQDLPFDLDGFFGDKALPIIAHGIFLSPGKHSATRARVPSIHGLEPIEVPLRIGGIGELIDRAQVLR